MRHSTSLLALTLAVSFVTACSHETTHAHRGASARSSGGDHTHPSAHATARAEAPAPAPLAEIAPEDTTAIDQSEAPPDLEITRHIRWAVVTDSSLSFSARNCVIVTRGAVVTLRGEVTRAERDAIMAHARDAEGVTRVNDGFQVTDPTGTTH